MGLQADSSVGHATKADLGAAPALSNRASLEREIFAAIATELDWTSAELRQAQMDAGLTLRDDLGLDSLHLVALQVAVEDRYGLAFDPADEQLVDAFDTVASLAKYVEYLTWKDADADR